jgi:hypothetical protein
MSSVDITSIADKKQAEARVAAEKVLARAELALSLFADGSEAFLQREAYDLIRELAQAVKILAELAGQQASKAIVR